MWQFGWSMVQVGQKNRKLQNAGALSPQMSLNQLCSGGFLGGIQLSDRAVENLSTGKASAITVSVFQGMRKELQDI